MLYLLDANVLIEANAYYYEAGRVPHFWQWLSRLASEGKAKTPAVILGEITPAESDTAFVSWMTANEDLLLLNEPVSLPSYHEVLRRGYEIPRSMAESLSTAKVTNDAVLISHALLDSQSRCVVTMERFQDPNPTMPKPLNRRIPLVCHRLGISCISTFDLIRELDFRIPLAAAPA